MEPKRVPCEAFRSNFGEVFFICDFHLKANWPFDLVVHPGQVKKHFLQITRFMAILHVLSVSTSHR
jgi:hypothetical protein